MKKFILIIPLVMFSNYLFSQNHFAQPYNTPLVVNPAKTGSFNGSFRFNLVARNERKSPGHISAQRSLFLDGAILQALTGENDRFAAGFLGSCEKNELDGIRNTFAGVSLSYHKALNAEGTQQLGIGFQTQVVNRNSDPPFIVFEDYIIAMLQAGYTGMDIYRSPKSIHFSYLDLNVGIEYQGRLNEKNLLSMGVASWHVNKPSKTFDGGAFALTPRFQYHLGWERTGMNKWHSYLLLSPGKTGIEELFVGGTSQLALNESGNSVLLGAWYQSNAFSEKFLIPSFGLSFRNLVLTASFDINISNKVSGKANALDLSLTYLQPDKANRPQRFLLF